MAIRSTDVTVGAGRLLTSPRSSSLTEITITAATSETAFQVSTTDAAKLRPGDLINAFAASATTPAFTAAEASDGTLFEILTVDEATGDVTLADALAATPTVGHKAKVVWHERGATDGGIELQGSFEKIKHYVDQSTYPVATSDGERSFKILAPLAEPTVKNLALAFGVADSATADVLQINSTTGTREDRFLFIGPGPDGKTRYAVLHRGQNAGTVSFKAAKGEKTVIALDIEALVDSDMTPDMLDIKDVA